MTVIVNGTTGISGVNGSAAIPAYVGVGTTTGIYFPDANTAAIVTNSVEAARIDSSGNFLINRTSSTGTASQPLQVNGGASFTGVGASVGIGTTNPSYQLQVYNQSSLGVNVTQAAPNATDIRSTAHTILSGYGGNYLAFGQYPSGYNYAQWIQSGFQNINTAAYNIVLNPLGGNVGIALTNPAKTLTVGGAVLTSNAVTTSPSTSVQQIITNGSSISITLPNTGTGFAVYLVTACRRYNVGDNVMSAYFVHYSLNGTPQAVVTLVADSGVSLSVSGAVVSLTNVTGYNIAANLVALKLMDS